MRQGATGGTQALADPYSDIASVCAALFVSRTPNVGNRWCQSGVKFVCSCVYMRAGLRLHVFSGSTVCLQDLVSSFKRHRLTITR